MDRRIEDLRRRIVELERDTRDGGYRGGGRISLNGGILARCKSWDEPSLIKSLYRYEDWPEMPYPMIMDQDAPPATNAECRLFYAFGIDSVGNSVGVNFDYDWILLSAKPYIEMLMFSTYQKMFSFNEGYGYYAPMVIVVYPILDPWAVPIQNTISGYSEVYWWANQPRTTFTDNLANGAPSGFINPSTNQVDNFLAHCVPGSLVVWPRNMAVHEVDPMQGDVADITWEEYAWYLHNGDYGIDMSVGTLQWQMIQQDILYPSYLTQWGEADGIKHLISRVKEPVAGTIYGLGFYLMTLSDYQKIRVLGSSAIKSKTVMLEPNWMTDLQPLKCRGLRITSECNILAAKNEVNAWHGIDDSDIAHPSGVYGYDELCSLALKEVDKRIFTLIIP